MAPEARRTRVALPPEKPVLVFDGECGFCRKWVDRWRGATRGRVEYAAWRDAASRFPEVPAEEFADSIQYIDTTGEVHEGAEGVFQALAHARGGGVALWTYARIPGFARLTEGAYRFVSRRRALFSRITHWLWGPDVSRPSYTIARSVFLRLLGLVYLIAFVSLWSQIHGLVGSRGILPAEATLASVRQGFGPERYWLLPTLTWFAPGDGFLHVLCGAGTLAALLLALGLAPALCCALLWLLYLSLTTIGSVFLGYQWDNLLLETGFLAIFLAPIAARCWISRPSTPPSRLFLALTRWLLFRLMVSSGAAKLLSGDPTWRDLSALGYHYETQPLPTWAAWYAHALPAPAHAASTAMMFAIELLVPFLILAPRRPRAAAFGVLVAFQLLIAATGNYTYFNLLTIVLCVPLLDDRLWPRRWRERAESARVSAGERRPRWILAPVGMIVMIESIVVMSGTLRLGIPWPEPARALARAMAPLRSVNGYGLFAVMTTRRPEIVIEGSDDRVSWLPYEFRWKPGDLSRRPRFVAPHQPRLDWQMWFAALGNYRDNPWFAHLLARLLEGSPEVLALLDRNPFPQAPPRYVRAVLYEYRFTDPATRRREGTWWRREEKGPYCPPVSLRRRDAS